MRSTKGNIHSSSIHEEEEEFEEEFSANKDGTSTSKDRKSNDRANAIRSKHSVTEQRRRCKINDRFQMLRDLIPHGDHKRDTASFLLEVIEYVKLLKEKVKEYEGSCEEWNTEPAKLMPWRYSHWRNQSLLSADADQDTLPAPFQVQMPPQVHTDDVFSHPSQGMVLDSQSSDCPITNDNRQDEHSIEGGTISISSTYSQELLATLTQALQSSGVDLSKARISIQIDLGKRANQALIPDVPHVKEHENCTCTLGVAHRREGIHRELEQAYKGLNT